MKTIEIKLFKFDELSEEAKQTALEAMYYINFYDDWYESIYEDAELIGAKIEGFDIDRGSYCQLSLKWSASEVCNKIKEEHGETCDTYKLAETFLEDWSKLVAKYSDGIKLDEVTEDNEYDFDNEADDLEEEFRKSLSEEYLSMLRQEYKYRASKEAIIEVIEANDYDFTENGKQY